jgi:hypothetical protein
MFCPRCRLEYEPGVTRCSDCRVALVQNLPDPPEYVEFVTVLTTGNPAILAVAKSLLDNAGIAYFAKGETVQSWVGGTFGTGFNVITGPAELQVDEEDADEAKEILNHIGENATSV